MSEFPLSPIEQNQLALLHAQLEAGDGLAAPFAKEIFLLEARVSATSHFPDRKIEPTLQKNDTLVLRREINNPHDPLAILILTEKGEKFGYIPRDRIEILARLMDAGKILFARLESKRWQGDWLCVQVRIFLRDI
jgi:HIRAN domain